MVLAPPAELDLVAAGLVTLVDEVELVEGQQPLAVVELGLDHRALLDDLPAGPQGREQVGRCLRWVRDEHPLVGCRVRVEPDHRLAVEILGHVGDQAVLTEREHEVVGLEEEAGQVVAPDVGPAPLDGDRGADALQRGLEALVALVGLAEVLPARAQEELGLGPRPVAREQGLVFRRPGDEDDARLRRRPLGRLPLHYCSSLPSARVSTLVSRGPSSSGERLRWSIRCSLLASSWAARPSWTRAGRSR